jgi:hypothetical protein
MLSLVEEKKNTHPQGLNTSVALFTVSISKCSLTSAFKQKRISFTLTELYISHKEESTETEKNIHSYIKEVLLQTTFKLCHNVLKKKVYHCTEIILAVFPQDSMANILQELHICLFLMCHHLFPVPCFL